MLGYVSYLHLQSLDFVQLHSFFWIQSFSLIQNCFLIQNFPQLFPLSEPFPPSILYSQKLSNFPILYCLNQINSLNQIKYCKLNNLNFIFFNPYVCENLPSFRILLLNLKLHTIICNLSLL